MEEIWISWSDLDRKMVDKEVVYFGASEVAEKTLRKVSKKPIYFIDNSSSKQNTIFHDIEIIAPEQLKNIDEDFIILINILAEQDLVMSQLEELGFKAGVDFFYTPVLKNQKIDRDIKNNDQTVLFTSAISPSEEENAGGGLYTFNFETKELNKIHSARFCQMTYANEKLYIVEHYEGVKVFNKDLEHVDTFEILPWSTPHGVAANEEDGLLYVANTGLDSITVMDINSGKHLDEIHISKNLQGEVFDRHHINDLCYYNGDLFVSMFSFSGMWKEKCYDGGIAKIDLESNKIVSYPIQDMWMPHSIDFIGGEITFIDSMRGDVYKTNNKKLVNISGFVRGIDYDGKYYYIGQSEHRYFDRLKDISGNIHINCGIHVFDEVSKASRFYSLDEHVTNIHSIMVKDF